jgi:ribosomal protein S18 acetylase RimI-like enzyme
VQPGDTVSLRLAGPDGPRELVGVLIAGSATGLTVRRRDGQVVDVARRDVTAGRVVPPGPARRIGVDELERVVARAWRPLEEEAYGEWALRASAGFTRRGNSALAVGDPPVEPPAAIDAVERWYAGRDLVPRVSVVPATASTAVLAELDGRGWAVEAPTHVMTTDLGGALRAVAPDAAVTVDDEPDDAWLDAFRVAGGPLPATARTLLTNHDAVGFASVRAGGDCVAIARVAVDGRWAGLSCVEVRADARGNGLGTAVSAAALRWAVPRGGRRAHLQVVAGNDGAQRLYERLGFAVHHTYEYRTAPEASVASQA